MADTKHLYKAACEVAAEFEKENEALRAEVASLKAALGPEDGWIAMVNKERDIARVWMNSAEAAEKDIANLRGQLEAARRVPASATLRDAFAKAALSGLLAGTELEVEYNHEFIAQQAYALGDAMLAEREKGAK